MNTNRSIADRLFGKPEIVDANGWHELSVRPCGTDATRKVLVWTTAGIGMAIYMGGSDSWRFWEDEIATAFHTLNAHRLWMELPTPPKTT